MTQTKQFTARQALAEMTTIVADTGDINAIQSHTPTDATTNPSLVLAACQQPEYDHLVEEALQVARQSGLSHAEQITLAGDHLITGFGREITAIVPRWVSTEVDARLSFDTDKTIEQARRLIAIYKDKGVEKDRVLIKIASTWEGIQAAKVLEAEGIRCNLTLLFALPQAVACAASNVTLISPFVGRIYDFYKKAEGVEDFAPDQDPGVRSVQSIYAYYKQHGVKTLVMGASFRKLEQILYLAGCDLLTIAPKLLDELDAADVARVENRLAGAQAEIAVMNLSESEFRYQINADPMASHLLSDGIRRFVADQEKLETLLAARL